MESTWFRCYDRYNNMEDKRKLTSTVRRRLIVSTIPHVPDGDPNHNTKRR